MLLGRDTRSSLNTEAAVEIARESPSALNSDNERKRVREREKLDHVPYKYRVHPSLRQTCQVYLSKSRLFSQNSHENYLRDPGTGNIRQFRCVSPWQCNGVQSYPLLRQEYIRIN